MSCVIVTNHAKERTKQRAGLSKRVAEKNAERAFEVGLRWEELNNQLKRYVDSVRHNGTGTKPNNIRIYCGNVYIFYGNRLVTMFNLPPKFRKAVDGIWRSKRSGVE